MPDITGASHPIELAGVEYHLSPLTDRDIEELTNWLRASFVRMASESLTPEMTQAQRDEVLGAAMREARKIDWVSGEGARTMGTLDGISRVLWHGLRKRHPDLTYEAVRALITDAKTVAKASAVFKALNVPDGVVSGGSSQPGSPKDRRSREKKGTPSSRQSSSTLPTR
jgi:hypothetical protein